LELWTVLLCGGNMTFTLWICLLATLIGITAAVDWDTKTPLDDYVNRPDDTYKWEYLAEYDNEGCVVYVVNMTSQTWKDDTITTQPVWWHHIAISIPKNFRFKDAGFVYIGGGSMGNEPPNLENDIFVNATCDLSEDLGVAVAYLKQIPNQPFEFKDDGKRRSEDSLIAKTWRLFIENTDDPEILLRMPMTKAVIRTMDTVNAVAKEKVPDSDVNRFMVAGASKRGWTAWTTAATDRRVIAVAPIVLDVLNMVPNLQHHFRAYGGWSFAFGSYYDENITQYLTDPRIQAMADIVDPYAYKERLTMPKVIISACGDEFFLPDDSHYFFDDMQGPTYMMLLDNTHHGVTLSEARVYDAILGFYKSVLTGFDMPKLQWVRNETDEFGSVTVQLDRQPKEINAVWADTYADTGRRDFRWFTDDDVALILWEEDEVEQIDEFTYRVEYQKRPVGWRGFFINALFEGAENTTLDFTTEINVIPDNFPYPACNGPQECWGTIV